MKRAIEMKRMARLWAALAVAGWVFLTSGAASAAGISCESIFAASEAEEQGINAGVDAAADAADVLGLPVGDAGAQVEDNQINGNLGSIEASLQTITAAVCNSDETISTPSLSFSTWSQAPDSEPDIADIPAQLDGTTGVATWAREVSLANSAAVTTAETASVITDSEASLLEDRTDGHANMFGIALMNMETDKATLAQQEGLIEKIKTADNIKELTALGVAVQGDAVVALARLNESVNQLAANQAQDGLNKDNEEKVLRDGRSAMANVLVAAAGLTLAGVAAGGTAATP